jgi:hypothetical protein
MTLIYVCGGAKSVVPALHNCRRCRLNQRLRREGGNLYQTSENRATALASEVRCPLRKLASRSRCCCSSKAFNADQRKMVELVVQVQCRHKSFLTQRELIEFGIVENAPIVAFVKRLRCTKCGSADVMASRVAKTDRGTRRTLRA